MTSLLQFPQVGPVFLVHHNSLSYRIRSKANKNRGFKNRNPAEILRRMSTSTSCLSAPQSLASLGAKLWSDTFDPRRVIFPTLGRCINLLGTCRFIECSTNIHHSLVNRLTFLGIFSFFTSLWSEYSTIFNYIINQNFNHSGHINGHIYRSLGDGHCHYSHYGMSCSSIPITRAHIPAQKYS
jgi:hypothetical protein